jgi:hypothetical protein
VLGSEKGEPALLCKFATHLSGADAVHVARRDFARIEGLNHSIALARSQFKFHTYVHTVLLTRKYFEERLGTHGVAVCLNDPSPQSVASSSNDADGNGDLAQNEA